MSYYYIKDGELCHYGVLGMKWGVRKAQYKEKQRDRLSVKALNYDKKSASLTKKSEKIHAKQDLEARNRKATKAANWNKKAAKLEKRAVKTDNDLKRSLLERKAERLKYKSTKARIDANRLSKTTGYGIKAMKYSIKSDVAAKKAAKIRKKIAGNNYYIAKMNRKISSLSPEELRGAYSFINEWTRAK